MRWPRWNSERERILARVDQTGDCWLWTGKRTRAGYGRAWYAGRSTFVAHRAVYTELVGPIPDGLLVCHHCDNPPCCNPAHLFLGTIADNNRDKSAKGRHPCSRKTHCPAGHAYDAVNTRHTKTGRRICRECHRLEMVPVNRRNMLRRKGLV